MKTKYWILILSVVLLISAVGGIFLLNANPNAAFARILSDGKVVETVSLHVDREFTVIAPDGGENTVTVKDGAIAVTAATCPDHYCMGRGMCSEGVQIVCLPNRLIIRFTSDQEADAVVG